LAFLFPDTQFRLNHGKIISPAGTRKGNTSSLNILSQVVPPLHLSVVAQWQVRQNLTGVPDAKASPKGMGEIV
jgi:hypothetical protein